MGFLKLSNKLLEKAQTKDARKMGKGVRLFQGETQSAKLQTHISKAIQRHIGNI